MHACDGEQVELAKSKEEVAKAKDEIAKAKEEITQLKSQVQLTTKASKEEERAKARTTAKITSLEKDNARLESENKNKVRDLQRQKDRSEQLEQDLKDMQQQIERDKARSLAKQATVRKAREWDDNDDDEDVGTSEYVPPKSKRSRLSVQPSAQEMIQQQVAEALSRLLPPGLAHQQVGYTGGEVRSLPPPVHQVSTHHYESPYGVHQSPELSQGTGNRYQAATPLSMRPGRQPAPVQAVTQTSAVAAPSSTYWPSLGFDISHDTPLGAALNVIPPPVVPASKPSAPADEHGNSDADMYKQFTEFMKMRKGQ